MARPLGGGSRARLCPRAGAARARGGGRSRRTLRGGARDPRANSLAALELGDARFELADAVQQHVGRMRSDRRRQGAVEELGLAFGNRLGGWWHVDQVHPIERGLAALDLGALRGSPCRLSFARLALRIDALAIAPLALERGVVDALAELGVLDGVGVDEVAVQLAA